MANPNKSANPNTWAKNPMERVEVRTFTDYREWANYVARFGEGFSVQTRKKGVERKVFVYKRIKPNTTKF